MFSTVWIIVSLEAFEFTVVLLKPLSINISLKLIHNVCLFLTFVQLVLQSCDSIT